MIKEIIFDNHAKCGMRLCGNQVIDLADGSQAECLGVRIGWIVISVNGEIQPNDNVTIVKAIAKTNRMGKKTIIVFQEMNFEKKGGECYNINNFPEATFWFFQHKMYVLGNVEYLNIRYANYKSGPKWNGFIHFLEKQYKQHDINQTTCWNKIQSMWNQKDLFMEWCFPIFNKEFPELEKNTFNPVFIDNPKDPNVSEKRRCIEDNTLMKYNNIPEIVQLRIKFGEKYNIATGTILSSEHAPFAVLTSAHNVRRYFLNSKKEFEDVEQIWAQLNGNLIPATKWKLYPKYKEKHSIIEGENLAVVLFPPETLSIHSKVKLLPFTNINDFKNKLLNISLVGFPGKEKKDTLWGMQGYGNLCMNVVIHNIGTTIQQSGFPLYYAEDSTLTILGINNGTVGSHNYATPLTDEKLNFIYECCDIQSAEKKRNNDFQKRGCKCFDFKKFPEATFWFFQYKVHTLGGAMYPNLNIASEKCGSEWNDFVEFLKKKHKNGNIKESTTWNDINAMWKRKKVVQSVRSRCLSLPSPTEEFCSEDLFKRERSKSFPLKKDTIILVKWEKKDSGKLSITKIVVNFEETMENVLKKIIKKLGFEDDIQCFALTHSSSTVVIRDKNRVRDYAKCINDAKEFRLNLLYTQCDNNNNEKIKKKQKFTILRDISPLVKRLSC